MKVLQVCASSNGDAYPAPEIFCLELTGEAVQRLVRAAAAVQALGNLHSEFSHVNFPLGGLGAWRCFLDEEADVPPLVSEIEAFPGKSVQNLEETSVDISPTGLVFKTYFKSGGAEWFTDSVPLSAISALDQQAQYVEADGLLCPACGSGNIVSMSGRDFEDNAGSQAIRCINCRATWDELTKITLLGFNNLELQVRNEKD